GENEQDQGEGAELVLGKAALDASTQEKLDSDEKRDREQQAVAVQRQAVELEERWVHGISGSVLPPSHGDVLDEADLEEARHERGSAVAQKRQGKAGHGREPDGHPDVDEHMVQKNRSHSNRQQSA